MLLMPMLPYALSKPLGRNAEAVVLDFNIEPAVIASRADNGSRPFGRRGSSPCFSEFLDHSAGSSMLGTKESSASGSTS